MTKDTNNLQTSNANINESKLQVVYRLDFAIKLKEKGYMEVFSKRNPQKPCTQSKTDTFRTSASRPDQRRRSVHRPE